MHKTMLAIAVSLLAPFAASSQSQFTAEGVRDLSAYLQESVAQTHVPGVVAMVADRDEVLYSGAFGEQNVAQGLPMTMETIFRIASMTKPVTSVAVIMLMEEGKLSLDDPIGMFLPELAGKAVFDDFNFDDNTYTTRPAAREVTVRHLLTHTSGFGYGFSNEILAALDIGPEASVQELPLLHDPGERWTYGESTRVLGTLVEKLSGQGLEAFMVERIFTPLEMFDTSFAVPASKNGRVATIHASSENGLIEAPNPEQISSPVQGDGGLSSTAADYVKFAQMLLNGGRAPDGTQLLSEESVELMGQNHIGGVRVSLQPAASPTITRPFPLGAGRDTFGLGFQITGAPREADMRAPGSMSWAGIFNTEFWIDGEEGITAVLLMQYLPFYDEAAIATLQGFEQRVYRHLEP